MRGYQTTLAEQMDLLVQLPLSSQPGTQWEYALGIDVLARLCEIATGLSFGDALQQHIFGPLGLTDTGFVLWPEQVPLPPGRAVQGRPQRPDEAGPGAADRHTLARGLCLM